MSVRIDKEAEASFMVVIPSHDWLLATRLEDVIKRYCNEAKGRRIASNCSLCDRPRWRLPLIRSKGQASGGRAVPGHEDTACITYCGNNNRPIPLDDTSTALKGSQNLSTLIGE